MMDYDLSVVGWLDEATLFHNEPSDPNFNFCYLSAEKTNYEVEQVAGFNDLPWFDEKVDLSILEDQTAAPVTETEIEELLKFLSSNSYTSDLSSEQNSSNPDEYNFDFNNLEDLIASPGVPAELPFSPEYEPISEADSPASYTSGIQPESDLFSDATLSPANASTASCSADESSDDVLPEVSVTICSEDLDISSQPVEVLSIEEVSRSVKNRKYLNNGKNIPKVKVSLRNNFHPYSKASSSRPRERSERKKVQNKEAAARYRVKKREEEMELLNEVNSLEAEQKKLKSQHDDLESEIKYLKKLMREVLQKKGIL